MLSKKPSVHTWNKYVFQSWFCWPYFREQLHNITKAPSFFYVVRENQCSHMKQVLISVLTLLAYLTSDNSYIMHKSALSFVISSKKPGVHTWNKYVFQSWPSWPTLRQTTNVAVLKSDLLFHMPFTENHHPRQYHSTLKHIAVGSFIWLDVSVLDL